MPIHAVTYAYPDRPAELDAVRAEHRAFLRDLHTNGSLLASGPLPATETAGPGALIVVDAPSAASVEEILDQDPFARAGLITERTVRPWSPVIGDWADRA
ncbi:YciI family protein [Oerskovia flava]|uniref:YciI family protein n=1 Tax=Oerskovia flava TaxID=2986422 RepID=UPI00223F9544|nr:YciI family protein [Oerskovia sp. JB1-3-2]